MREQYELPCSNSSTMDNGSYLYDSINNVVVILGVFMDLIPCYRKDTFSRHGIVMQIQGYLYLIDGSNKKIMGRGKE